MTPDLAPESHPFLPTKRVFHIRPTVEEDAPAILSIEEHISKYSPTATRNQTASLAEFEDRIISLQSVPQAVHSIAKFGRRASDHAVEYVVESTEAGHHQTSGSDLPRGALGYTVVVPWQPHGGPTRDCYLHTARMIVSPLSENILDEKLHYAVHYALISNAISTSKARHPGYKSIIHNVRIPAGQQAASTLYHALQGNGFEQVGRLKKVMESKGVYYDFLIMQREL